MQDSNSVLNEVTNGEYKYGFVTDIDTEVIHRGLDEETVRIISAKSMNQTGYWNSACALSATGRHWKCRTGPC